jgi:hypothetical protein
MIGSQISGPLPRCPTCCSLPELLTASALSDLLVASALLNLLAASALPNPQVLLYLSELLVDAVIARTQVASLLLAWLLFVTAKILLLLCHTHHCGAGWPLW